MIENIDENNIGEGFFEVDCDNCGFNEEYVASSIFNLIDKLEEDQWSIYTDSRDNPYYYDTWTVTCINCKGK